MATKMILVCVLALAFSTFANPVDEKLVAQAVASKNEAELPPEPVQSVQKDLEEGEPINAPVVSADVQAQDGGPENAAGPKEGGSDLDTANTFWGGYGGYGRWGGWGGYYRPYYGGWGGWGGGWRRNYGWGRGYGGWGYGGYPYWG